MSNNNISKDKAGYLTKQGKTVRNWRRRWITLKNNHLHYYKAKEDASPLASIPLSECTCSFALYYETKRRSCLKLNTQKRTWYFAADTDEEIGQWLEALFMWNVPESKEEDEVINAIIDATNALQSIATSVVQCCNGPLETFRDVCRTAALRGDTFTGSIQAITKYNSSVKYNPTPNNNDFLKDVAVFSGSIRDSFLALITLVTLATDARDDQDLRKKLNASSVAMIEKLVAFKKMVLDDVKGLRAQLRTILYGKQRAVQPNAQPSTPLSPQALRSSGGGIQLPSVPPLSINSQTSAPTHSATPPSPSSSFVVNSHLPTLHQPQHQQHQPQHQHQPQQYHQQQTQNIAPRSSSPRPLSQNLSTVNVTGASSLTDERSALFEDLVSMSKDLAQIMKNLRSADIESVAALPKSGYVTAMMCVKAARDYANIHHQLATRQAILAAAGRVFVATNQLYNPLNNDEEYSTDELLRALSQSVVALVTIVLHHHNNAPPSPVILAHQPTPNPMSPPPNSPTLSPPPQRASDTHQSNGRSPPDPPKKNSPASRLKERPPSDDVPSLITSTDGDVNIWDEVLEVSTNVVFIEDEGPSADGELPIRGGTLNQIIKRLTNENKPELRFVKAFIITYQSFATAEVFLNKLIQRYQVPVSVIEEGTLQNSDWRQQKMLPIQLRVYNVLKLWLENGFHDFTPALLAKLKIFMDECMRRDGHAKLADQLQNIISRKLSPENNRKTLTIPSPVLTKEAFWKKYPGDFLLNVDEEELAKQLTLIEFATYRAIEPLEVLNQAWNKVALRARAPNVMRMISRFNSISFWVARMIVNEEKLRSRVKLVTKLIRFAQALYKENNLNSLLAVVSGLGNAAIHRLRLTHEELSNKETESLVKFGSLLSTDFGYKNYRARVHNINPPLIPYLGIYLTDLTFIEEGNPDFIEGKLINFKKREMIFNVISEIQQYQQEPYKIEPNEALITYLAELPIVEGDPKTLEREHKELYDLSLKIEPRSVTS